MSDAIAATNFITQALQTNVSTFKTQNKKLITKFIYYIVDLAPITFIIALICKLL